MVKSLLQVFKKKHVKRQSTKMSKAEESADKRFTKICAHTFENIWSKLNSLLINMYLLTLKFVGILAMFAHPKPKLGFSGLSTVIQRRYVHTYFYEWEIIFALEKQQSNLNL